MYTNDLGNEIKKKCHQTARESLSDQVSKRRVYRPTNFFEVVEAIKTRIVIALSHIVQVVDEYVVHR